MRSESSFRIAPKWSKIGKLTLTSQFLNMTLSSNFFNIVLFLLSNLVTGPRFMFNISSRSGVMTIFFYKGLTRNPEIENTPVWIFPNIWSLARVRDTKVGTNVNNKISLNAAEWQSYSLYRFWVIKVKPTGLMGRGGINPSPRLGLITFIVYAISIEASTVLKEVALIFFDALFTTLFSLFFTSSRSFK